MMPRMAANGSGPRDEPHRHRVGWAASFLFLAVAIRVLTGPRQGRRPSPSVSRRPDERPSLLCISHSFSPDTTPTAIRAGKLLSHLAGEWDATVLTEARGGPGAGDVRVEVVGSWQPRRLIATLRRLRLNKLLELLIWPDFAIFWLAPAFIAGRRLIRERTPSAIVVFMMPYSAGLVGVALSRMSGLPLILNLDDSPTCTDMHPHFPTRLHYRLARALEDFYVRAADAVVYVSATNLDAVASRLPEQAARKLSLVRYGADRSEVESQPRRREDFEIAYVGAMSGWWALIANRAQAGPLKRMYTAWNRMGRYELTVLDQRTSSPAIIGGAITDILGEHPGWAGRVKLQIHGNPYPDDVVARALKDAGVAGVVEVSGPVPHERVAEIMRDADLLFLTLPTRVDGSRGGRISAKTYEYLTTDRPILAAVPRGENWDYLEGKPGVWVVEPDDRQAMREIITELAQAKFEGRAMSFNRDELQDQLSYAGRAGEFSAVIRAAAERRQSHARR